MNRKGKPQKKPKSKPKKKPKKKQRWVVKAGSNVICAGGPLLIRAWMQQVALLKKKGIELIWVTSGAIASAVDRTSFAKKEKVLSEKQALSAIGQPILMDLYNIALQTQGLLGAQILLSYDDLSDPKRLANFKNTVEKILEWGMVPVLNENDAVATEELKFGDNDSLSAKVAHFTGADQLVILTDVEGLYDSDPKKNKNATLIQRLAKVPPSTLRKIAPEAGSTRGTGGMYSKLKAAREATEKGIRTWLIKGDLPSVLIDIAEGRAVGTRIGS